MAKLTKEGIKQYPHFSGNVQILKEDEERYRIRALDNRMKWIPKSFIDSGKKKTKKKKEQVETPVKEGE